MKKLLLFVIIFCGLGGITAQSSIKHLSTGLKEVHHLQENDTLKILAVMVDFQEDKYDATVGSGKFGSVYTKDYGDTIIDPMPHDAGYFSDHMEFAKNYYKKVSNGKVNITYNVLPEVITVSKYMRDYSPVYNSNDYTPVGNFAQEVWNLADKKFTDVKFSNYDLFIIFHAGVSAGIDLGYFTIDRNLPSIYIGPEALKKIFGNQFNGFPVNNNSAFINNTIIMPETESRESVYVTGEVILTQFSINGFLVNNIASYLGLPDLYNTETGRSVIGRFGLMDSQGLNAFWGMFPPEPSPWEKIYLGWEQPITVSREDKRLNISTRLTASPTDTTLIKIPINSSEYFLIENRSQDANKDFMKITYKRSGNIYTKIVHPDTNGIYYVEPDSIDGGVVIDVDEFDAAVPGSGIVIWHIDDNIINQNLTDNKINAGEVKGIYVVEADGIPDIGQVFNSIFGQVIGEGSNEDLWYKGNKARLYKNKFSNNTKPNSSSNTGASSLITLENISEIGSKMGFDIKFGLNDYKIVSNTKLNVGKANRIISAKSYSNQNFINILENSNYYKYDLNGNLLKSIPDFSDIQPVTFEYNFTEYVIGAKSNNLNIYWYNTNEENLKSIECAGDVTAISADIRKDVIPKILLGLWIPNAQAVVYDLDVLLNLEKIEANNFVIADGIGKIRNFGVSRSMYSVLFENTILEYYLDPPHNHKSLQHTDFTKKTVLIKNYDGNHYSITLLENNQIVVSQQGNVISKIQLDQNKDVNSFSVSDLFNDGQIFVLVSVGSAINVYNLQGMLLENFPFQLNIDDEFTDSPLTADIDNDGTLEILSITNKGNLYAVDPATGKVIPSFPISIGSKSEAGMVLIADELATAGPLLRYKPYLAMLSEANELIILQLSNEVGKINWDSEFGNSANNSFLEAQQGSQIQTEFFPSDKAYNWPNPVYENETNIRYYVSENSTVNIKVFDLAGDFVAELNDRATGGYDNETKWNVTQVQSGVYYAHIDVKSDNGKSASKIIKIAVIK